MVPLIGTPQDRGGPGPNQVISIALMNLLRAFSNHRFLEPNPVEPCKIFRDRVSVAIHKRDQALILLNRMGDLLFADLGRTELG